MALRGGMVVVVVVVSVVVRRVAHGLWRGRVCEKGLEEALRRKSVEEEDLVGAGAKRE